MPPIDAQATTDTTPDPDHTARSFYEALTAEGFTGDQVVGLATLILDLVHADLAGEHPAPNAK